MTIMSGYLFIYLFIINQHKLRNTELDMGQIFLIQPNPIQSIFFSKILTQSNPTYMSNHIYNTYNTHQTKQSCHQLSTKKLKLNERKLFLEKLK